MLTKGHKSVKPSEHATSVQRLPNVVQTYMTFGQRWLDNVTKSNVMFSGYFYEISQKINLVSYILAGRRADSQTRTNSTLKLGA